MDYIITGASRGIGRALVQAIAQGAATSADRIVAVARDGERLRALAQSLAGSCPIIWHTADLSRVSEARALGHVLAAQVSPGATLVHNAGLWPTRLQRVDGVEAAFATNCLGLIALHDPLLQAGVLSRVLVVSAGLIVQGHFDAEKTPVGDDFSRLRTYCSTKLAGAVAMRDAARAHPQVDFAIVHPGIVNTDLGVATGAMGWLTQQVKRFWETPEVCAARLLRILQRPRWEHTAGEAPWFFEEHERPWPPQVERDALAVRAAIARHLHTPDRS